MLYIIKKCIIKKKDQRENILKWKNIQNSDKAWISSKSNKIPLLEKLKEANKVVDDLSKDKIEYLGK